MSAPTYCGVPWVCSPKARTFAQFQIMCHRMDSMSTEELNNSPNYTPCTREEEDWLIEAGYEIQ